MLVSKKKIIFFMTIQIYVNLVVGYALWVSLFPAYRQAGLLPIPYSLFPTPYSLFPIPYSLFPIPAQILA
jgi:hypothetical protein